MRSDQTGEDAGSAPRALPGAAGPCAPSARERLVLVLSGVVVPAPQGPLCPLPGTSNQCWPKAASFRCPRLCLFALRLRGVLRSYLLILLVLNSPATMFVIPKSSILR